MMTITRAIEKSSKEYDFPTITTPAMCQLGKHRP